MCVVVGVAAAAVGATAVDDDAVVLRLQQPRSRTAGTSTCYSTGYDAERQRDAEIAVPFP